MFLIAYRREVADRIQFPDPTHWIGLPPGYDGTRAVALKLLRQGHLLGDAHAYLPPPEASHGLIPAVTAEQAIGDMPPIYARKELEAGSLRRGARRFDAPIPYDKRRRISDYARLMRSWPGFAARDQLFDHVIRYLPRDYPLFARLNPGDQYPQAWQHAMDMFEERLTALRRQGMTLKQGSEAYERVKASIVPPYDVTKFPNKWRKMWRDQPARTLMAHLGKDSYSHIHYDDDQARTISVREAARLQSFPDGFVFCGTMNPAGKQIGNAVPPLLAKAVATTIRTTLQAGSETEMYDRRKTAAAV
jgi:DNA (cytosine-5)-methyltransferase 1